MMYFVCENNENKIFVERETESKKTKHVTEHVTGFGIDTTAPLYWINVY